MPQIVEKELYEKVQEIFRSRKKSKAVNKAKESYLLSGLIRCGECGYAMYGNRRQAKNKPLYVSIDVVVESVQVVMFVAIMK